MDDEIKVSLLCTPEELAKTTNMTARNVRKTYIGQAHKHKTLQCLDLGSYCVLNKVSPHELVTIVQILVNSKNKTIFKLNGLMEELKGG